MNRHLMIAAAFTTMLAGCSSSGHAASPVAPPASPPVAQAAPTPSGPVSAAVLAGRLKDAGLPLTHLIVYTPATDPNHLMGRQGGYTSKVAWQDPRAIRAGAGDPGSDPGGTEFGGGIEVYPTRAGELSRYSYLKSFTAPIGDGYDYLVGTAILRLSQYLTPAQAQAADHDMNRAD
jgi:hypothetical protein